MPDIHAATDVHLVSLAPRPIFASTMPSKVQSILAAGKPVTIAVDGDAAAVVAESGAGWVPPGTPSGLRQLSLQRSACHVANSRRWVSVGSGSIRPD